MAGAFSMAIGEYTSVSSQRDAERADIAKEKRELAETPERELRELTRIYIDKGLSPDWPTRWRSSCRGATCWPCTWPRSWASPTRPWPGPARPRGRRRSSFSVGALIPLLAVLAAGSSTASRVVVTAIAAAGRAGRPGRGGRGGRWRARFGRPTLRMLVLGGVAMAAVALIGHLLGVATG